MKEDVCFIKTILIIFKNCCFAEKQKQPFIVSFTFFILYTWHSKQVAAPASK